MGSQPSSWRATQYAGFAQALLKHTDPTNQKLSQILMFKFSVFQKSWNKSLHTQAVALQEDGWQAP